MTIAFCHTSEGWYPALTAGSEEKTFFRR